jgi:hypothetical protein
VRYHFGEISRPHQPPKRTVGIWFGTSLTAKLAPKNLMKYAPARKKPSSNARGKKKKAVAKYLAMHRLLYK